MIITKFRNPWYTPKSFGPQYYPVRDKEIPQEYKGYYIFRHSNPWVDVVEHVQHDKDNEEFVCVTQRVTLTNAKAWIDSQGEL